MDARQLSAEVEKNYDAFQRAMGRYLPDELGRYALLRHGKIIAFFDDAETAEIAGEDYADKLYSIQLVDPEPVNLGLYSNG